MVVHSVINYTIPLYGNKRVSPYGDLVISDGEITKTAKIKEEDDGKQFVTFKRKRFYVYNAGRLYSPEFVISNTI